MLIPLILAFELFISTLGSCQVFSKPIARSEDSHNLHIPTPQESAIMARRILRLTPLGTFSTIFPSEKNSNSSLHHKANIFLDIYEHRPRVLGNTPIGLIEYIADCEASGNPTVLAISIATTFKNVAAGSNISLSLSWTPPYLPSTRISSKTENLGFSAASLPRFSLFGYLEPIKSIEIDTMSVEKCFLKSHPDAKYWLPGNHIHTSVWNRLVVQQVYWIGGFGDRAYIGWIPVDLWKEVTNEQINRIRLPGEKKLWKELFMEQNLQY